MTTGTITQGPGTRPGGASPKIMPLLSFSSFPILLWPQTDQSLAETPLWVWGLLQGGQELRWGEGGSSTWGVTGERGPA